MELRQHYLLKYNELFEHYKLLTNKIRKLRHNFGIETDVTIRFKLEEEIKQAEEERNQIENELDRFEEKKELQIEREGLHNNDHVASLKNGKSDNNHIIQNVSSEIQDLSRENDFINSPIEEKKKSAIRLFHEALGFLLSQEYKKAIFKIEFLLGEYPEYPGAKEILEEAKTHLSTEQKANIIGKKLELLSQSLQNSQYWHFSTLKNARHNFDKKIENIERTYNEKLTIAKQEFAKKVTQIKEELEQFNFPFNIPISWEDPKWKSWKPNPVLTNLSYILFGTLKEFDQPESFGLPAILPFKNSYSILFKVNDKAKQLAVTSIQALLLRLLSSVSPGKLRFTFFDPIGLGQNVAPFINLADYDETLIGSKAWSEKTHIERQLVDITEHMSDVIQKFLRDKYDTIDEFNKEAGELAEPYRFLVILDFPVNFSEDAANRLVSIIQNGARCGVYAVILYDTTRPLPYGFNINNLEQNTTVINWDEERFIWEDTDFRKCQLELDQPPNEKLFNKIIEQIGQIASEAEKVEVPFERILERSKLSSENWWKGNTKSGIQIPIGQIGANKIQYFDLGKNTAQHALVAGKTGSGKSTLLHVMITALILNYSPDELELYLIDFKKGVEFKTYAAYQLPHARVIAIESEREFGLSVIEGLDVELKHRGDLFRKTGVDTLSQYRQKVKRDLPRILLLVDEFQEFFTEDDAIASKASLILDRLIRQGRAFGIHVILGSQTLAGVYSLARSTIDQMAVRIALQCSETDSRLILSDDNAAARLLTRPGEAIYNSANGLIEGNNLFQVAWLSDEQQDYYLSKINELAKNLKQRSVKKLVIFEGNAPADITKNQSLSAFLLETKQETSLGRARIWLGEPIAMKTATEACFRRQSGSNLLIVGQNTEAALSILVTSILSLLAQYRYKSVRFYIVDFGSIDVSLAGYLQCLSNIFPDNIKYGHRRLLSDILNTLAKEVDKRLSHEDKDIEEKIATYLIINGIHRARDLEKSDDFISPLPSFSFALGNEPDQIPSHPPSLQFQKILQEGPDFGIHTLVWCDTLNNLRRRLDYRILKEFEMRIVFQMSSDDSLNLIDSPLASKLGQHRALIYSEEEGRLEKFRPFEVPAESWLQTIGETLKKKSYKNT